MKTSNGSKRFPYEFVRLGNDSQFSFMCGVSLVHVLARVEHRIIQGVPRECLLKVSDLLASFEDELAEYVGA